ncbi:MAG: hypothetical protein BWY04_00471 [candidate division CPR1 bacterium ADurb.Bin160]|uniref:Uncharacterized protein n=1 Tax=candidate division CPR1 bacterium ADurb.Bin160 TaxID=1852826 RepID=A0A1V5ZQ43_9BACT|nr:MAG: hypothetical protein BWY04_00471 [candidate division CPR1 bacterium ADurb.Bin160]
MFTNNFRKNSVMVYLQTIIMSLLKIYISSTAWNTNTINRQNT